MNMREPGSPSTLEAWAEWCCEHVEAAVSVLLLPRLLFADGRSFADPQVEVWELTGGPPSTEGFLARIVPAYALQTGGSQIAASIPVAGALPTALLVAADETGVVAWDAVEVAGHGLGLGDWRPASTEALPVEQWQRLLALVAGYRDFTKWWCRRCGSVCPVEADELPAPCDFCASRDIELVSLTTPLVGPWAADAAS